MSNIHNTQQIIQVDVAFYDETERKKLLKYSTADRMEDLVLSPMDVPMAEFLTYFLFHRKKLGLSGYRDFSSIGEKLSVALNILDECIDFNGQSICVPADVNAQLTEITEHVGEAIGLSVSSRIHGLTEADWELIPAKGGRGAFPSFDFQIASDGKGFVQVENKGSSVDDNREIDTKVKAQYRRIIGKKYKLRTLPNRKKDPYPASLRYGTITAVDPRQDGNVRCWLTDPPPDQVEEDPRRFRLLRRMQFLRDWIGFISPRSQLAAALSTRVADMMAMSDPFDLNGIALRRGNNEPFEYELSDVFGGRSSFLANKSRITDGPAGGVVVQLSERELMLLGIREDLVQIATEQDFESISDYKAMVATVEKKVQCVFSWGRFRSLRLPDSIVEEAEKSTGSISFKLAGNIHYSPAGLVFGRLELPNQ